MAEETQQVQPPPLTKRGEFVPTTPPTHIVFCEKHGRQWVVKMTASQPGSDPVTSVVEQITLPDLTNLFKTIRLTRERMFASYRQKRMIASREAAEAVLAEKPVTP